MQYPLRFLERVLEKLRLSAEFTGRPLTGDERAQVVLQMFHNVTDKAEAEEILRQVAQVFPPAPEN